MDEQKRFSEMSTREKISLLENAIYKIVVGGQAYTIGSRQLTRADLSKLREMKREYENQLRQENTPDPLFSDMYAGFFDRR